MLQPNAKGYCIPQSRNVIHKKTLKKTFFQTVPNADDTVKKIKNKSIESRDIR